jgi:nitrate/nitrite transporter NarK
LWLFFVKRYVKGVCTISVAEKWLTMVLLCLSGSFIYWLPFYSDIFYVPMQSAFGFSNTQIGFLSGTAGFASLITFIPGGWLADRLPARQLMSTALVITAMGGFVLSRIPSFEVCLLLYGLWGASAALVFWSALIKATRNWAPQDEQGRAFGFLEGGRSISDVTSTAILLAIFAYHGADSAALSKNIQLLSSALLVLAVLVWVVMKDKPATGRETQKVRSGFSWATVLVVLKMPIIWLLGVVILAANSGMWGTIYFTPYATEIYGLGDVGGGAVGAGKYALAAFAAITAGFVADRIGTARAVVGLFFFMTLGFLLFGFVRGAPALVPMLLINAGFIATTVFALRGIYYALLEQGGVPVAVTGTAVGLVSVIGYTPDAFAPVLSGLVLDAYPGARGYQILFLLMGGLSFLGLVAATLIYRRIQAGNSE